MRTGIRILGIILIFFFGVFIGASVTSAGIMKKAREVMRGGPDSIMEVVVKRLGSELKLDPEQKRKLQTIVDDAHIKLRQSQDKIQPEISATLFEAEERVRAMLYQNQVAKFDRILSRSRDKWKPWQEGKEKGSPSNGGETVPPKEKTPAETPKPTDNAPPPGTSE